MPLPGGHDVTTLDTPPLPRASGFGDLVSGIGSLSSIALPWFDLSWGHDERMRDIEAQERVGLSRFGAGRADTFSLTPQPYAFTQPAPRRSVTLPSTGGISLGGMLPLAVLAVLLIVLFKG